MAYSEQDGGKKNQALLTGRKPYLGDGTNFYPQYGSTAEVAGHTRTVISQREPFEFRPGATVLSGGAVPSGTRTGAATLTTGTVANSTYWDGWKTYQPVRGGKIDGLSSGGILWGQLTIGTTVNSGTGTVKLTADIANTSNTSAPTTFLTLTGTISCTTAETFQTFDINYLKTNTVMNSIPFSMRIGGQHQQGGSTGIFRIMESSVLLGEFEPGT